MIHYFNDFAMTVDLMLYYDEYVEESKREDKEPMSFNEWYDSME